MLYAPPKTMASKTRTDPDHERRIRAYHEAGHAITGHKLGFTLQRIAITSEGQHDGTTRFDIDPHLEYVTNHHPQRLKEQVERYMTMIAAGGLSGLIALPIDVYTIMHTWAVCKSDRELLRHFASQTCDNPSDRESRFAYIENAKERAWLLLQQQPILYAIEYVAEILLAGCGVVEGENAYFLITAALASPSLPENTVSRELLDLFQVGKWCAEDDDGKSGTAVFQTYNQFKLRTA